ncbi:peptide/nickel transport system substrate-binding protein [Sanguibacter gelidistatuariae]|uniref:Peptide/nickel transport system substrate-binding protein n=1 Tax=Sanguibacter gelidistatuariae TaxID=1814289 RepID=A0A1G6HGC9_9MICO|nr:ABC transporter substrate-binding protein [Sanguibacter gelidistatuariae]SDB92985.1 peptide/nickel transport system substrate-binding protein [Sanguibacter gelidistatuariae]
MSLLPRSSRPPRRRLTLLTVTALAGALTLSACAGGSSASSGTAGATTAAPTSAPTPGGDLRFALGASPQGVDPQQVGSNVSIYIARQLADSLTDQDPKTGEIVPWLASSWEVSPDLTQFTFHLRDDVTFSDGTALTAETVKKNFDSLTTDLAGVATLAGSYLAGYTGTTVVDEHTVTVAFAEPNAQFLQATSTVSLAIVSDATTTVPAPERLQGKVIGSGPFTLGSYTQDQGAAIVKRAGYNWASDAFDHQGEAYLDSVTFSIVPESGVRAGGLASDQFDAVGDVLPQDVPLVESGGGAILNRSNPGITFILHVNTSKAPLDDAAVRQAVQVAINRQELVDTVLSDKFLPATSVLAANTPGYKDLSDKLAFEPDKAAKILDEDGWVLAADGIREKDGQKLTFDVVYAPLFTGSQAVLELTQQQLRAVGIDLELRQQTPAEQSTTQKNGDYDTYYYNSTRAEGDILRTGFSSKFNNLNRRAADTVLDPLLESELSEPDAAKRADLLGQAQDIIVDEGYAIPIFELAQSIGVGKDVQGLGFEASSRLKFYDAWIQQ